MSFANAVALEDSALAMTAAVANNTWAAEEKIAAATQQSAIQSAYHTFADALADSALDFAIAEANEASLRDDAQNAARLVYSDAAADVPLAQQTAQWNAMADYAEVQIDAARAWADAVKEAAAYLKRGLNDAEAEAVERVARIVAEHEILAKHLDMNAAVATTAVRWDATVEEWARKLAADLAAAPEKFFDVQLQRPTAVETQMRADANSSRPTDFWSNIEGNLNTLTGGASRAVLLSPEFTAALNAIDGFFAGLADTLSLGASTQMRALLWGETATRNHTGGWFLLGQITGEILITIASFGANPCAMGTLGRWAFRAYEGGTLIRNSQGAFDDIMAGNYLSAGLHILGMIANLGAISQSFRAAARVPNVRWGRGSGITVGTNGRVFGGEMIPSRMGGAVRGPTPRPRPSMGGRDPRRFDARFAMRGDDGLFKGTDALRKHNEVVRSLVTKYKLTKAQQRQLHDEISGMKYTREEIEEIIKAMFGK